MKNSRLIALAITPIMVILAACSPNTLPSNIPVSPLSNVTSSLQTDSSMPSPENSGQIYLYGELHGVEKILNKELELWSGYYHNENMRHLFVELSYYTAEYLNLWMQADNDDLLDALYSDWEGTASHKPAVKEFYQKIKSECPETIFHGTDVGHQYNTTGQRFLTYLEANGLKDSDQYLLTQDAIAQGKHFYDNNGDVYRENKLAENFIREYDQLNGESVMGIYGGAHTEFDAMDYYTKTVPCMANQLKQRYNDAIHSESLAWVAKNIEPFSVGTIKIGEKQYRASYFGKEDLTGFQDFTYRELWRLENAYDDFKDKQKTGDVLPNDNYPMLIEAGQVFVIDYGKTDDSVTRTYYRSDGDTWQGRPTTREFEVD